MALRVDHLVHGDVSLDAATATFAARFGVVAAGGGTHDGFGTHNALIGLGADAYLELLAPDPDQPAPAFPRPFGIDALAAPGLIGWAVQTDDIDASVARARAEGFDPGDPLDMQRMRPDGVLLRWRLTPGAMGGGLVPFLIDWGTAEHPTVTAPTGPALLGVRVEHPDPAPQAAALAALDVDAEVVTGAVPALVATVDGRDGPVELR